MADSIIGFKAVLTVTDGVANAAQSFSKAVTIQIPAREYGEYEEKCLVTATKDRKFRPTLVDNGTMTCTSYFNRADYIRMVALLGVEGKTWKLTPPDEDGTGVIVAQTQILEGWLKKIGEVVFEKDKEVMVTFELRVNKITVEDAANES